MDGRSNPIDVGEVLERVLQKGLHLAGDGGRQKMSFAKAAKKYVGKTTADDESAG